MHFSSIITTLLMQAICISLHFQPIKNFSFLLPTLEEVGELNFKGPLSATSAGHSSVQSTTDTSAGDSSLPAEFDWRDHHKVTSVRDQRQCNACYAFAVTSAIESALAIQYDINIDTTITRSTTITVTNSTSSGNNTENGNSTSNNLSTVHMVNMEVTSTRNEHYVNLNLSVQQLIDCTFMKNRSRESNTSSSSSSVSSSSSFSSTKSNSNYYRNNACQYGYIEDTFRYVVENGLLPEEIYPYEMQKSACRPFPLYTNRTFIRGYEKRLNLTENEIKALIYTSGPVITLINDKGLEFFNYKGGIIKSGKNANSFKTPTHAVLIVGWGIENNSTNTTTYWTIKNSWSTRWGELGFARIQVATRGIGRYVFYPLLEKRSTANEGRNDPFRTVIVYIFLAILITSLLTFYAVAQVCNSAFFDRTKATGSKYFRVAYSKPKAKFEVNR